MNEWMKSLKEGRAKDELKFKQRRLERSNDP